MESKIEESLKEYSDYLDGKEFHGKIITKTLPKKIYELNGESIKELRKEIWVTQKWLAYLIGVLPRTIESWKMNRTKPSCSSKNY